MPPRDAVTPTDTEDEILALIPEPTTELADDQLLDTREEFEEESTEDEPMEEDPQEEEPYESEPEEEPEESDPEEAPPSPIVSPEQIPPLRTYREYPDGPLPTPAPTKDPYLPPSPATLHPLYRWAWIRRMIGLWRREEGDRIPEVVQSPDMAPVCSITSEPTHLTVPLIIARLFRHENQLHELQETRRTLPNPDLTLQVHRELQSLRSDNRELWDCLVHLEGTTASRIDRMEEELRNLHSMMEEMSVHVRNLRGPRSGNGDQ